MAYLIDWDGREQKMVFEDTEKAVIYAKSRGLRIIRMHRSDYRAGNLSAVKSTSSNVEKKGTDKRSDQNA